MNLTFRNIVLYICFDIYAYWLYSTALRPDINDLLFLVSFPDPFQRVERNNNKNKRKNIQEDTKLFFGFQDFPRLILNNQCIGESKKQEIK